MKFTSRKSIYQTVFPDEKVVVVPIEQAEQTEGGVPDITKVLQEALSQVKRVHNRGIVMLPEGTYQIHDTVCIPRGIRLFGFGANRPLIRLAPHSGGFEKAEPVTDEALRYMFWFIGNAIEEGEPIRDANAGTFYSALSNVDLEIGEGNNNAAAIRAHFAQNSYVSYCHFETGDGFAGIHAVGNEMEHLSFSGGEWGIYTGKCSPGWPFVLTETDFEGQRKGAIHSTQSGMTILRTSFKNLPGALESKEEAWDKLVLKDCVMEQVKRGFLITDERNICTQINVRNVLAKDVSVFAYVAESGKTYEAGSESYLVKSFVHGIRKKFGATRLEQDAVWEIEEGVLELSFQPDPVRQPEQDTWVNVKQYGAVGDGSTDDTEAIRKAIEENETIYFPQGRYRITDTIVLKEYTKLLGFHPMATEICLADNEEAFAGIGAPKAMIETPQGGKNYIRSIGVDSVGRNPRAVAIKWQAGEDSGMYDIKFTGGHGKIEEADRSQFQMPYNRTRTWDANEEYDWDSQYWSLWVTNQGGGSFKNIWTACPYAAAGIYISKTATKGIMYQVSSEHHVRQELVMKDVENWEFYAFQTEEEVAEGSYCQPFELSDCRNLLFANLYAFRVIWVDNPYDAVMRIWNCEQIEIQNFHNFTQMKYTIQNAVRDMNSGITEGEWQMALFEIGSADKEPTDVTSRLPKESRKPVCLVSHLDAIDAMCSDEKGKAYICDSRLKRIYVWDQATESMSLLLTTQYRPLSVASDTEGNLLVVVEYRPVKYAKRHGVEELSLKEFGERSEEDFGACFYPFFRRDRRVRVITIRPDQGEESIQMLEPVPRENLELKKLYYPVNQWRDNGDMKKVIELPEEFCYVAPDGVTGIVHTPALARATMLAGAQTGRDFYAVDEYNKYVLRLNVEEKQRLSEPEVVAWRGEYSALASQSGTLWVTDNVLYAYPEEEQISFEDRPACLCWLDLEEQWMLISARTRFYIMKI